MFAPVGGEVRVVCRRASHRPGPRSPTTGDWVWISYPVPDPSQPRCQGPSTRGCCFCATRREVLADVLKSAIGYARTATRRWSASARPVETVRELFETEWTSSADVYLPDRPPGPRTAPESGAGRDVEAAGRGGRGGGGGPRRPMPVGSPGPEQRRPGRRDRGGAADMARGLHRGGPYGRPPGRPWTPVVNGTPAR